jgi:hypothetical protein
MQTKYWVIGADYTDFKFEDVIEGTSRVLGPYAQYGQANTAWREVAQESRYRATTRFTIVTDAAPAR